MKRRTIKFICALFLLSIAFTSCERHYYEGRGDNRNEQRHHRYRDHDNREHRDNDHRDNR